jgi:hypothetical protein
VSFLHCALSEWPFLRTRLLRTRLGLWLLLLLTAVLWLERTAAAPDPLAATLHAGGIAAILCVGYLAGARSDRIALSLALLHPRSPGAVAVGRWLAATGGAALVVLAAVAHAAWTTGAVAASLTVALAGVVTAAAVSACALALAWIGGNILVGAFLVWLVLLGGLAPEAVLARPHPGLGRIVLAGLLEVAPGLWRYRRIAVGDAGAAAHAAMWVTIGLCTARWRATRAASGV